LPESCQGAAIISARNKGIVATIPVLVNVSGDADVDGIPDDFEITNSMDPGGHSLVAAPPIRGVVL
jgi:hypothetical protein